MENLIKTYWPILAIALFLAYKWWKTKKVKEALPELMEKGAIIIDVRSPAEFLSGNAPGSINIPLNELNGRISEIDTTKEILLCCASGARSQMALGMLSKHGIKNAKNIGSYRVLL